jgi:GTP-dependent dephospho-CoA kinase
MYSRMPLSPEDIHLLKNPFGVLIHDKYITKGKIKSILKNAKRVVSVGDSTTDRLLSFDITPDILVVDGVERRVKRNHDLHSNITAAKELHCNNPPGSVSKEAFFVLCQAFNMPRPVKVIVDGEEDMLALPIITIAPQETFVLYGQPLEGMVIVNVNPEMQAKANNLMERIGIR